MKTITFNPLKTISLVFMSIALLAGSCKKAEKGDTGPQGPAGPSGVNGVNGTNGVANITTFTGTTTNASWTLSGSEYDASFNVSAINSDVVSNGMVMAYLGNTAQTAWQALPTSYQNYEIGYSYYLGTISVQVSLGNGSTPSNPGGLPFKFVVIPPAMVKPSVNVLDYNEVKTAYGLKD